MMRILYVEDNPSLQALYGEYLSAKGAEVRVVDSGASALLALLESVPDILLLDLQLPGMSGIEVLTEVRRKFETETLPVVVLTSFALQREQSLAEAAGCNLYLTKPISPAKLLDELTRLANNLEATEQWAR